MSEFAVAKFGGSSAAAPERVADIITANPAYYRLVMLSAIGRRPDESNIPKVTDMLIGLENAVENSDAAGIAEAQEAVIERHREIYSPLLGAKALQTVLDGAYRNMQPDRSNNGYQWIGEGLSARLFAALTGIALVSSGLRFVGGQLDHGRSLEQIYRKASEAFGPGGRQAVMPPFYGYGENYQIATLRRGGSDIAGVLATAAMRQGSRRDWTHENHTDRDGVMSSDPSIVTDARSIQEMTHEEIREQMHGVPDRNGVVHGDAVALADRYAVNLTVKNTYGPDLPGTRIVQSRESGGQPPVIAISGGSGIASVNVYDMGMAHAKNYLTPILERISDLDLSVSRIPMSEDGLKIIFDGKVDEAELVNIREFIEQHAVSGTAKVTTSLGRGDIRLVGQDLRRPEAFHETLNQATSVLSAAGISCSEVISREDGCSIGLTVVGNDVPAGISVLHKQLIEES